MTVLGSSLLAVGWCLIGVFLGYMAGAARIVDLRQRLRDTAMKDLKDRLRLIRKWKRAEGRLKKIGTAMKACRR